MAVFGKITDGASNSASSADRMFVSTATPASSGTATSVTVRCWITAGTGVGRGVIYANSAGAPGALLATSDELTISNTAEAENVFTLSGANQIAIVSGTPYWIGWAWDDPGVASMTTSRDATASGRQEQVFTYPTMPNPFGTAAAINTGPIDAYVTYTEGVTTTQTQTGISRIDATLTQTQTGKSRITNTTTQTQTGKSRITTSVTQNQTGTSRVTASVAQSQIGIARVVATTSRDQTGIARVMTVVQRTQTGISRITASSTRTQTGISRVTIMIAQDISGAARITNSTTRTQVGIARVGVTTSRDQTGVARVSVEVTTTQTQDGTARIEVTNTQVQTGTSRIEKSVSQTQTGVARIFATVSQTQQGRAAILLTSTRTQTGVASIVVSQARTQTGVSRIVSSIDIRDKPGMHGVAIDAPHLYQPNNFIGLSYRKVTDTFIRAAASALMEDTVITMESATMTMGGQQLHEDVPGLMLQEDHPALASDGCGPTPIGLK